MNALLRGLGANLWSGTRLSFFLPVRAADFRVSAGQYAAVVVASFAAWLVGGMLRGGFPGVVNGLALVSGLGQLPLVLLACLLAAVLLRDASLMLWFAVLITATDPVFEAVSVLIAWASRFEEVAPFALWLNWAFIAWGVAVVLRAQIVASGWRGLRSVFAAALFLALFAVFLLFFPRAELWSAAGEETPAEPAGLMSEDVFHLQARLLDSQLADLEDERPGVPDLYFLGAAPDGTQDGFVREADAVRTLMDERFDTVGRSVLLANHAATLTSAPLATSTNLGSALGQLGDTINPEEDVVMLYLSTHGSPQHELSFQMPPLVLRQVNATMLSRMLADSGIKWRIIVISACASGAFIEPLRDDNSLIITASDATASSPACEAGAEVGGFGRAFLDAARKTHSFTDAFEQAKKLLAEREKAQGLAPSNPQMHLGKAMQDKLEALQRRLDSDDPGRESVQARSSLP